MIKMEPRVSPGGGGGGGKNVPQKKKKIPSAVLDLD
jgi:hypothetical protein